MRRAALTLGGVAAVVALVLFALAQAWPGAPRTRLLDLYVLFVAALSMLGLVRATREAGDATESVFDRALRRRSHRDARPPSLAKLEREVVLAAVTEFDFHARLRPALREIAAHKLAGRGLVLDSGSPATRAALGDGLWELLRPDRPPPHDRLAPGVPLKRLQTILDKLDEL
jgi:hypothetical protein